MSRFVVLKQLIVARRRRYALGIAVLLGVDGIQLIMPKLLGRVADLLQEERLGRMDLLHCALTILGLAVAMAAGRYLWRMKVMGAARLLDCDLRDRFFRKLQTLSVAYFNRHTTGDLMAHATNDIQAVRMAAGPGVVMSVDAIFLLGMTTAIMARTIDWRLTAATLAPLPFLAAVVIFFGRQIHNRFLAVQQSFAAMTDHVQENLAGVRVVKAFVREEAEVKAFTAKSLANVRLNQRLIRVSGLFSPLISFIGGLCFLLVLVYGGTLVVTGAISLGGFVAALNYLGLLVWPMTALGWVVNIVQRGLASLERLHTVFAELPEVADHPQAVPLRRIEGEVRIANLTFTYPGAAEPALAGIDITLAKGRTLAIVGRTGAGKTTLVNLILRLYNPPPGAILIDGVDVNRIPLQTLRTGIGVVPQDDFLFSATIGENIGFGGSGYTDAEIESAAATAQVDGDIKAFPEGFQTAVGERGVTLSGGQKQRVSLARALIKNPRLLILDDCLSAVDTRTEDEILKGLRRILAARTNIVISHRISSIQDADEIVVLEAGRIAERGTHASLLALGGLYADLHQKQILEEELASAE